MIHIESSANFGDIGSLLGKKAQVDITDEQIAENYIEEQAEEENMNVNDERLLQEAAVAVEEVLMSMQIPEEQWPLVIQRTRIQGL